MHLQPCVALPTRLVRGDGTGGVNVRLLSAGPFVTMINRFAVASALIPITVDFQAPVGEVAIPATAYYLACGLAQPFWALLGRAGRIRVIRISLATTAAACTLPALAPNLDFLSAARASSPACPCALSCRRRSSTSAT